ncbi:DMT family transporter [Leptolyngbya sp. FACHB-261]|uniref:DMT family transporter n=1 Tax=Leptolyngbya sp. FACHB-261 TaxID=2692806 RepID=UPI0016867270|nr:DMT family transporter [Leptolyngbya sp. FACHB-261]MBD2103527.1 DMT family transporter [Leptolyngbya sp. FACHB-261]
MVQPGKKTSRKTEGKKRPKLLLSIQQPLTQAYLKLAVMTLIWGGSFIAGRAVVQTIGPFSAAFCRYAIATLLLLFLTIKLEGGLPRLKRQQLLPVIALGLSGIFAYNAFFFLGLQTVEASRASLIVTTNPTVIALSAALVFRDKLTRSKWAGILTALLGAALVITRGNPQALLAQGISSGDLFLLGCVASWTVYTLVGKRLMVTLSPFAATTYACLVGTPLFLIPAIQEGLLQEWQTFSLSVWLGILYLAVLGTVVAFCWYYEGLKAIGPTKAAIFINLVPVVAVTLAALLLNEPLTPVLLLGGLLVLIGVSLTNRS